MGYELGESLALLPGSPKPRVRVSEPGQSRVKKFICGRSAPAGALSVEGPAKNQLRRTVMLGSHQPEPVVNQRGLSNPGPGNDCYDVDILVCPGSIQESNVFFPPKNIARCDGQFCHRNLFWSESRRRSA